MENVLVQNADGLDAQSNVVFSPNVKLSKEARVFVKLNVANGIVHASVEHARLLEENANSLENVLSRNPRANVFGLALERTKEEENVARSPENALERSAVVLANANSLDSISPLVHSLHANGKRRERIQDKRDVVL